MVGHRIAPFHVIYSVVLILAASSALAAPPLPAGLSAHVRPTAGGQIDWAGGYILAEGIGKANGRTDQDRMMAQRAADVVAARNALLIVNGLPVDARGKFANLRVGEVRLRGVVKGHERISSDWRPNRNPPECEVRLRVPIWGAKGVASLVYARQRQQRIRIQRRIMLAAGAKEVESVLIIDARGMNVDPCLFPVVQTPEGVVFYDLATVRGGDMEPVVQYAETRMTYGELRAAASVWDAVKHRGFADRHGIGPLSLFTMAAEASGAALWGVVAFDDPPGAVTTRPTTQPTTQPDPSNRRRKRRVVRAVRGPNADRTTIVLTKEDAEQLAQSPEGAAMLRGGKVVVVVDSVAAGIQGAGPDIDTHIIALVEE